MEIFPSIFHKITSIIVLKTCAEVKKEKMSISPLVLISEFVIVDHGKYIVKVSALSNDVILGTALAGADTVEKAEDEARKRAIEVIDWTSNYTSQAIDQNIPSSSSPQKEQKLVPPLNIQPISSKKPVTGTNSPSFTIESSETRSSVNPPVTSQNNSQKTPKSSILIQPEASVNKGEKTIPRSTSKVTSSSISESDTTSKEIDNDGDNLPLETKTKTSESNRNQSELNFTLPSEEVNPVDTTTHSVHTVEDNSPTSPATEMTGTMDFSQIINQTTIELKRLGWTQEDGKKYLLATYGKKSRHLLSDEELIEFLNYLQQQPSS